jgi:hypothetical protein
LLHNHCICSSFGCSPLYPSWQKKILILHNSKPATTSFNDGNLNTKRGGHPFASFHSPYCRSLTWAWVPRFLLHQ